MAQPFISLIKFRRGDTASLNEAIESNVVFEEGEPIYITDSRRMLIGSGELTNNLTVVGNKLYESEPTTAYTGDLLYKDNFLSYYNGETWSKILPAVDGTTITYNDDNKLTTIAFNPGNGIAIDDRGISVKKSNQFTFNEDSELTIASNAINKSNLNLTNIFDKTIFNLSTEKISIKHDNTLSITKENGLTINQIPEDIFKSSLDSQLDLRSFINDENDKITITDTIKKTNSNDEIIGAKVGVTGYGTVNTEDSTYRRFNGTLDSEYSNNWKPGGSGSSKVNNRSTIRVYTGPNAGPNSTTTGDSNLTDINSVLIKSAGFITLDPGTNVAGRKHKPFAVPAYELPDLPIIVPIEDEEVSYKIYGKNLDGMYFFDNDGAIHNSDSLIHLTADTSDPLPEIRALYGTGWKCATIYKTDKINLYNTSNFYTLSGYTTAITNENYPIFAIYRKTPTQTMDGYTYTIYVYFVNYNSTTATNMRLNIDEIPDYIYPDIEGNPVPYNSVIMRVSFSHPLLQGKPADFLVKKEINVIAGDSYIIEPDNIYEYGQHA